MNFIFWVLFIGLNIFVGLPYLWYFVKQIVLKGSIFLLKLFFAWGFFMKFLLDDHHLWYRLFITSVDFEFLDLQTETWFFKWLNWNLVHLEFVVLFAQMLRVSYLYFCLILYFIESSFIFLKKNWKKFFIFSIFQQNFLYLQFYFIIKFNIIYLFSTSLLIKIWLLFLWWRTYFFIMTRLDFNFYAWSCFNDEAIQGQLRGFKLEAVENFYCLYLYFFRPIFFSTNIKNKFIYFFNQNFYLIYQYIYIYFFNQKNKKKNIYIFFYLINEDFFREKNIRVKVFFIQILEKIWINSTKIRFFLFKNIYIFSLFCILSSNFILTVCWYFFYLFYKIRKILLIVLFIGFFGFFFFYELSMWLLPTWNRLHGIFSPITLNKFDIHFELKSKLDKSSWFSYLYFRKWYFHNIYISSYNVMYHWPIWDYDFLLMSLKRIGEMETDEGEPIEDWQTVLVWLESFKWTPIARNSEAQFQLWTEGLKLKKLHKKMYVLNLYHLLHCQDSINWARIFRVKYYPYDLAASWYRRVILWKWWSYIFWKRAKWKKKKWYRMIGRLRNFTNVKYKLFWRLYITPDWYNVWIWFLRFKFYFVIAIFDTNICFWWFFGIYSFISWYYIKILIFFCIKYFLVLFNLFNLVFFLIWNFIFFNFVKLVSKIKYFFSKVSINNYWYLLYLYIKPFLLKFNLSQEFKIFFNYWVFYCELLYNYLLISFDFIFYGYTYRPVWGNWLKTIFTSRDYIKSFFDIFYLEYDSLVHRRYTYRAYYLHSIACHKYNLKRRRARRHRRGGGGVLHPRLLKRVGLGRFLFVPNNLVSEHFGRILGLAYDSKLYWKCKRFSLRLTWFMRSNKLFRTFEYLIICIWVWIICCLFFFVGFRYFFHYKSINDFNGLFYWHKLRKQPIEDLSILFRKLDKRLIKSKLQNIFKNLDFARGVWMTDFKLAILTTDSENMKKFYKASLKSILNRPTSFKWRLRTLKNDVLNNWDKVEFLFFDKSTENYFETWITYSTLLSVVLFELMLITSNKEIYGLSLNTIEDEDIYENVESSKFLIECGNKLANYLFQFFFWIDANLFKYKLPDWIWHKDGFLCYQKFYPRMMHSSSISFDEYVIDALRPILVWSLFIPLLFFFSFRNLLKRRKWKNIKWAHTFWKIAFWYHFDLYGEGVKFLMRAYFNAQCYAMYRGKFSGKSFVIMRRRKKLKCHRRFIWHYLNTCYAELAFVRIFVRQSSNIGPIFLKRGALSCFLNWFNLFWWVGFFLCFILYSKLLRYSLKYFTNFRSQLTTMKSFREFVVYWMHVEIYMQQKIILHKLCKKYGFNN
jgi:hypothetical protein